MTPTELRVKVAEAMGWTGIRYKSPESYLDAGHYGSPPGKPRQPEPLPDFGARDWSATGAVLDEIERRGGGLWLFRANPPETLVSVESGRTMPCVQRIDQCIHRAICLAFLEAHARAKEPK